MKLLLTLLLFIPTLLFSQRIEKIDGKYKAKIEYSVDGKSVDYIFNNANSWIKSEFSKVENYKETFYPKRKVLTGFVHNKKISFQIEVICYNEHFITKFSNFYLKRKELKPKKISKMNQYLFELSGRMQKYIRYNEIPKKI